MTKRFFQSILLSFLSFIIISCKNDVFIDYYELPENTQITITGDGGQWSSTFSRKGLTKVFLEGKFDEKEYIKYYSLLGTEINADASADEFGLIVFENPAKSYMIGIGENKISINSFYNAYSTPTDIILNLVYENNKTKRIYITITPGSPLTVFCTSNNNITTRENVSKTEYKNSFTNGSSLTQTMVVYPYLNAGCIYKLTPLENWADGFDVDCPIPLFINNEWILMEYDKIKIGEQKSFLYPDPEIEKISVEVPPYKKATLNITVYFSEATHKGDLWFHNPVMNFGVETGFIGTTICPTSYEYSVSIE